MKKPSGKKVSSNFRRNKLLIIGLTTVLLLFVIGLLVFSSLRQHYLTVAPDFKSQEMQQSRQQTKSSIEDVFERIEQETAFIYQATAWHDKCYEGQNNYKVHDGYTWRCSVKGIAFFGFNGDFRNEVLALDQLLSRQQQVDESLSKVIQDYYDKYIEENNYYVDNLPNSFSYYVAGDSGVYIHFFDRNAPRTDLEDFRVVQQQMEGYAASGYEEKNTLEPKIIDQLFKKYEYIVAIGLSRVYYEKSIE